MYDKLDVMLDEQYFLQKKLGYDFNAMTAEQKVQYIKEYQQHTDHELHEMLAELPFFKPWKKYSDDPEEEAAAFFKAREEFIDAFHFVLNIAIALGFSANELHHMYLDKNKENHERQEDTKNYKVCVEESK